MPVIVNLLSAQSVSAWVHGERESVICVLKSLPVADPSPSVGRFVRVVGLRWPGMGVINYAGSGRFGVLQSNSADRCIVSVSC